jgi:CRISPR-associated protein Csd2
MSVERVFWWKHSSKSGQYSSAKVHKTLVVKEDGSFDEELIQSLEGLKPEIIDGF